MPHEPSTKRTVAFVDGQNLYYAAREAFGYSYPNYLDNVKNEKFLELFEAFKSWAKDSGFATDKDWRTFQETLIDALRTELSSGIDEGKFQDVFEKAAKELETYINTSGHLVKKIEFKNYLPELAI